jgi:hypothetical protein
VSNIRLRHKSGKTTPRRLLHHATEHIDKESESVLERDIIEPAEGPRASGVALAGKIQNSEVNNMSNVITIQNTNKFE